MNKIIRSYFTLTCLIFVKLAFGSNAFAADRGFCAVGMVLRPGQSCAYYGTEGKLFVSADGIATFRTIFRADRAEREDIAHTHDPGTHDGYVSHGTKDRNYRFCV